MSSRFPPQEGEGPSDRPAVTQTGLDDSRTIATISPPISTRVDHDRVSQPILSMILLEHPEDLGRAKSGGEPGSIWRWKSLKDLAARPGVTWGALAQLSLGAASVKPTRLLTNIPKVINWLNLGPPVFGGTGKYMGPLPFTQAPAGPLIGKPIVVSGPSRRHSGHPRCAEGWRKGFSRRSTSTSAERTTPWSQSCTCFPAAAGKRASETTLKTWPGKTV